MLKRDQKSQEDFVVRGILDGYLLYENKIVLFDYKTDRYDEPSQLVDRYRSQLSLYEEALSRAYSIENIEKYLILLGKDEVQVVKYNLYSSKISSNHVSFALLYMVTDFVSSIHNLKTVF